MFCSWLLPLRGRIVRYQVRAWVFDNLPVDCLKPSSCLGIPQSSDLVIVPFVFPRKDHLKPSSVLGYSTIPSTGSRQPLLPAKFIDSRSRWGKGAPLLCPPPAIRRPALIFVDRRPQSPTHQASRLLFYRLPPTGTISLATCEVVEGRSSDPPP